MSSTEATLDSLLQEDRTFPPPPEFAARANERDPGVYARADADPEAYWAGWAERLDWFRRWERVLEWEPPYAKWFVGGKLNASHNCLDVAVRRRSSGRASRATGAPTPTPTCTARWGAPPTRSGGWG